MEPILSPSQLGSAQLGRLKHNPSASVQIRFGPGDAQKVAEPFQMGFGLGDKCLNPQIEYLSWFDFALKPLNAVTQFEENINIGVQAFAAACLCHRRHDVIRISNDMDEPQVRIHLLS
jgi:hypothetical protein